MSAHPFFSPLASATDPDGYGGKAAQLATALGCGLPVPDGFALCWSGVRSTVSGDRDAHREFSRMGIHTGAWAVRSSAVGEDSATASFAGAHLSVLGVVGHDAVLGAVRQVHDSVSEAGAVAYRERLGVDDRPRMGVVVQQMVASDVAGVMFTRNPITGASERLIEASWGLGESVVAGMVIPDQYRVDPEGTLIDQVLGEKDTAVWLRSDGSTEEGTVAPELVERFCLTGEHLRALHRLARSCDRVFGGTEHDIEFAFVGAELFLLQRRPITHG